MAKYKINVDSKVLHQLILGNSQDAGVSALVILILLLLLFHFLFL